MANGDANRVATGLAIRARRRAVNLSQRGLGTLIGRGQSWVAKVESGCLDLSFRDACAIAAALACDVGDLIGELPEVAA